MKKRKALFVLSNLTTGGIQSQALLIAKFMKYDLGYEVLFWGIRSKQSNYTDLLDSESIHYEMNASLPFLLSKEYFELGKISKLKKWVQESVKLKRNNVSVVFPFACAKQMNILKLFTSSVKLSFYFERGGHDFPVRQKDDWYDRMIRWSRPVFLANSFHGAKALGIIKGVSTNNLKVVRNAVFEKAPFDGQEGWQKKIVRENKLITFTMIANFFSGKDHEVIIEAFSQVLKNHSNIRLLLAGMGGPKECQDRMIKLSQEVQRSGISDKIIFLGSVRNTKALLDVTDVGVLSSRSEGCPNVLLEYMHTSLPIIASDIQANIEVLPESQKEFLFEKGDSEVCAAKIDSFLRKEHHYLVDVGNKNKKHVENNFSLAKLKQNYRIILEENSLV